MTMLESVLRRRLPRCFGRLLLGFFFPACLVQLVLMWHERQERYARAEKRSRVSAAGRQQCAFSNVETYLQRLAVLRIQRGVRVHLARMLAGLVGRMVCVVRELVHTSQAGFRMREGRHRKKQSRWAEGEASRVETSRVESGR